jgi:glutathione S-transferase
MEHHLRANDWFAAGATRSADIALYAYTHSADEGGFDLSPYESIRGWLDGVRM